MKVFGKFINWYFGRSALPYWCIMIFDLMVCFLSGVFIVWLRHPASDVLAAWPQLMHTLGLFAVLNFISFRVFHTYSGILRYSQFVDLMRVTNACVLSMLLAFYVEKRIKCEFLFYRLNKSAIFATVDSDTKIKIEVYNSIIFLHNVKK